MIIVGYSQSATIAKVAKRNFIEDYDQADPDATPIAGFVLVSDPNKPDGGILERYKVFGTIPFFGITFGGISDHPVWVLNFLAMANALVGYVYLHGQTPSADDADLIYQGSAGDTDYYVVDNDIVPILRPLGTIGGAGIPAACCQPDHVRRQPDPVDPCWHRQRVAGTRRRQEAGHHPFGALRCRRPRAARSAGDDRVYLFRSADRRTRCTPS